MEQEENSFVKIGIVCFLIGQHCSWKNIFFKGNQSLKPSFSKSLPK